MIGDQFACALRPECALDDDGIGARAVIGWSTYLQDAPIGVRLDLPGRDDGP